MYHPHRQIFTISHSVADELGGLDPPAVPASVVPAGRASRGASLPLGADTHLYVLKDTYADHTVAVIEHVQMNIST